MRRSARRNRFFKEPFILPQWAIERTRPFARNLSQLLWRTRYKGVENVPLTGGLIIASNHQTYIDPFWIGIPVRRPLRYLAWSEAFDWPVIGRLMGLYGAWPLQIDGKDPAAIRRSIQYLREGGGLVIFPEGGRCGPDGAMSRFKTGAARMALEAGVPVLPVTIRGGHRVWPKGQRLPRFRQIEIIYHPLQRLALQEGEDIKRCARRETDQLNRTITAAI